MKKLLFNKKKAQLDKVKFAKKKSFKIDINNLPKEIESIIEIAKDFLEERTFIK